MNQSPRLGSRNGRARLGDSLLPFPSLLPSWCRASPAVTRPSCATCLLRQMRWERDGGVRGAGWALWRGGGRAAPTCVGSGSETPPGPAWHLGAHPGMPGGGSSWGPKASSCMAVCSCPGSLCVAGDAWMEDAIRPVPLCVAKHLADRCYVRHVTCPCLARSGKGRLGSWPPGAWRGSSSGSRALV